MEPITEIRQLENFEYLLQSSFFSADLHITRAWSVCSNEDKLALQHLAKVLTPPLKYFSSSSYFKELHGSVVNSVVELSQVVPPISLDAVITAQNLPPIDSTSMIFTLGLLDAPPEFRLSWCIGPISVSLMLYQFRSNRHISLFVI